MENTDQIIHDFCIYEIDRHTIKPYENFRWTKVYKSNSEFQNIYPEISLEFRENELIICSTYVNAYNYTLLTTQHIISNENGTQYYGNKEEIIGTNTGITIKLEKFGCIPAAVSLKNDTTIRCFIEAGKAWMVTEYGIRSLVWSQQISDTRMINLMRIWDKKREAK